MNPEQGGRAARAGLSLTELVVVIGIMAVLTSMLVIYGSQSRNGLLLSAEQAKIAQIILRAKELTITSYGLPGSGAYPIFCGFGVHFNQGAGTYEIFNYYDTSKKNCAGIVTSNNDPIKTSSKQYTSVSQFTLSPGLTMQKSGTIDDIFFVPPDPLTIVWINNATTTSGNIILVSPDGSQSVAVTSTSAGQVSP